MRTCIKLASSWEKLDITPYMARSHPYLASLPSPSLGVALPNMPGHRREFVGVTLHCRQIDTQNRWLPVIIPASHWSCLSLQ